MVFKYGKKCTEQIQCQAERCLGETTTFDQVISSNKAKPRCLHVSGTALIFLVLGLCLVVVCRRYLRDILEWVQNLDDWEGVSLFVVMFTLVSFPMTWGYIILNVAAGYLYGFFYGLVVVFVSATCGVTTAFIVCRRFMKDWVRSILESDSLKAIVRVVEARRGYKVIALARLTPIPFGLQNGLFAVTNVGIPKYVMASSIGLLPSQALNAYMGSTLRSLEDVMEEKSGGYMVLFVQVVIGLLLMFYVIRRARKEINKACEESEKELQVNGHVVTADATFLPQFLSRDIVGNNDVEAQRHDARTAIKNGSKKMPFKKGHRKSHSASAILIEANELKSDAIAP
ncbi:predicted protein [Nematostella vectensis]|uniref:VTT domain-containing protein n=1 Tax=Nematostella vectensis TaxID=45351 RepID=A7SGS9_NEMVE|nr:predicted protein [Nematostella vectensis]|eukprot:XP_001629098.1 predicted protein [Nematostella vectensis]